MYTHVCMHVHARAYTQREGGREEVWEGEMVVRNYGGKKKRGREE